MPTTRQRMRALLDGERCVPAAPIFDPLSARIADSLGWELLKLTGSSGKAAGVALPDEGRLAELGDLVDACRRITRVADVPLIVDADDAGGTPLRIRRAVRELEAAGAAAVEIEDLIVASSFAEAEAMGRQFVSCDEQVARLEAAVAARRDPAMVLIARTRAVEMLPTEDALTRVRSYAETGVDMLYLPGTLPRGRADIEASYGMTKLPLALLRFPADADEDFLRENRVCVRTLEQTVYSVAVQAMHDGLEHLFEGGDVADLAPLRASKDLLQQVTSSADLAAWEAQYVRD